MLDELLSDLASGDETRAERAAAALGSAGSAALTGLGGLLNSADPDIRWWVARTLGNIDAPAANPLLKTALQDSAPEVRQCAARALIARPAAELVPDLAACLRTGDALLASLAGSAMAAAGEPAVPALIEIFQTGSQRARVESARALAAIKDPRAIPFFFHAIQEGDSPLVEYWADIGLDNLGIGMTFFG